MDWRATLRPASFRGIAFDVDGHDASFGRRQVTHEYPQRDTPYTEDLGRSARNFTIEAYLVGDDYPTRRDRLIAACETPGPGELVHPYLGAMQVECTGLTLRESSSDGRLCRLQLQFVEAGHALFPSVVEDPVRTVSAAAVAAQDATDAGFCERFATAGFPSFVVAHAAVQVRGFCDDLLGLTVNPTGDAQTVAGFFARVRALAEDAVRFVRLPADLADEVLGIVHAVRAVFGAYASDVLRIVRNASSFPASASAHTANHARVQINAAAFAMLARQGALAEECTTESYRAQISVRAMDVMQAGNDAVDTTGLFRTREEAIAARDALTEALDAELEAADTTLAQFQALMDLRTAVVRNIPSQTLRLPRIAHIVPPATVPSLVVSHAFYGTAARAVEIATRNRVRHPGFLPGGRPLEVLTRE